jgi:hypothetical protein
MSDDLERMVGLYVQMRDQRDQRKRKYEEEVAELEKAMSTLEVAMLGVLSKTNSTSCRTAAGTVYRSTKTSATVGDWESLLKYVREHDLWHMLKKDVSKRAVEEFRTEHNDLPPGVDWRETITVGVRRS